MLVGVGVSDGVAVKLGDGVGVKVFPIRPPGPTGLLVFVACGVLVLVTVAVAVCVGLAVYVGV